MPRHKKKPTWWKDPTIRAVIRRGLLYLIRHIYGEISPCVNVCLKQKREDAVLRDQKNKGKSATKSYNSEVECCSANQGIYDVAYGSFGDPSAADTSQGIGSIFEAETSEISTENILGESSSQDEPEVNYGSAKEHLIQLLHQRCPEVASCLRQADHTSSNNFEDLCDCLSAIYEATESSETKNTLKACLLQFIEQLYPGLTSCIKKEPVRPGEEIENVEEFEGNTSNGEENNAEDTVKDENEQTALGEFETVENCYDDLTTGEIATERLINDEVEDEDISICLEEYLMELIQQSYPELPNCIIQNNENDLKAIESDEEWDYEEENEDGNEEEFPDGGAEYDEKDVIDDYENYDDTSESVRDCLIELIRQIYPEMANCIDENGDQTGERTADIPTDKSNDESDVKSCLLQLYPELAACIEQFLKDYANSNEEETLEDESYENYDVEEVQDDPESYEDSNDEVEYNEDILRSCLLQLIHRFCPDLINGAVEGTEFGEEINDESGVEEYYSEEGELIEEDGQNYEDIQSECESESSTESLIQLFQQLYSEIASCVSNSEDAESEECEIEESGGTTTYVSEFHEGEEEMSSERIDETLKNCFLNFVEQMYPELGNCIRQSTGAEFDKNDENEEDMNYKGTMEGDTMYEVQEICDSEQTISENHSNIIRTNEELSEDTQVETSKEDEEDSLSVSEFSDAKLKECLLQFIQQLYPELADFIKQIEELRQCHSEGIHAEVSTDDSTKTDNELKERMLEFFGNVYPELANCIKQARNSESSDCADGQKSECTDETLRKCFLRFVEQLYPELANCIKETTGDTSTAVKGTSNEEDGEEILVKKCGDVEENTVDETFTETEQFERSESEQTNTQTISTDESVGKSSYENGIEDQDREVSQNLSKDENGRELEENNDADAEWNDANTKEALLGLIQKLYPELAKCIRKYESVKMSCSDENDAEESIMSESDHTESLSQFIDQNYPDLANCFKLNKEDASVSSGGVNTESECEEETMRNRFLKFVEELYPDLAICIKQSLGEVSEIPKELNSNKEDEKAKESDIFETAITDETNTDEKESKEGSESSRDVETPDYQCESDATVTDRTMEIPHTATQNDCGQESEVNNDIKTECRDNGLSECLMHFIQQMCPELADCVKQYNDVYSSDDDANSDVSISEVSEALEASSSEGDIKDCLLKFIDLLYPELAKCIRESDKSFKPRVSEVSIADISEGTESASSQKSLTDCLINFIEEEYPKLANCIQHVKKMAKNYCDDDKESDKSEVDKDETTIDESIIDEVKTEQILNENNDEDSQNLCLTTSEQRTDFDDEEKSELTITPDEFTEDFQMESEEPDHLKGVDGQSEVTATDDADNKTEGQSIALSHEISITEYIPPLISGKKTKIDDEEAISSEDIFEDCFLRILEQFNPDLASCIMQNLHEYSAPQIEDSDESGIEYVKRSEDLSISQDVLLKENTFTTSENDVNKGNSYPECQPESRELLENVDNLMTEENFSMASEIVPSLEISNSADLSESIGAIDFVDENLSMVSEVFVSENMDNSIEGSALNEEDSASIKMDEFSNSEIQPSDSSRVHENIDQDIQACRICEGFELQDDGQASQQNFSQEMSYEMNDSDINITEQEEEEGTIFDSLFDENSHATDIVEEDKFGQDSEKIKEYESTAESVVSVGEQELSSSEYQKSDGVVESPVVEENTDSEAEVSKQINQKWTEPTSGGDPKNDSTKEIESEDKFIEESESMKDKTEVTEGEVSFNVYTEDSGKKDAYSTDDGATDSAESITSEENFDELDELRGCLLAIADEFYPELAICIRKCLADEVDEVTVSDSEMDRRNMQLCLEKFAAKYYANPALKLKHNASVPGLSNVEEMPTPTVRYIQQLILDFARIFHPKLADILQQ